MEYSGDQSQGGKLFQQYHLMRPSRDTNFSGGYGYLGGRKFLLWQRQSICESKVQTKNGLQ